MRGDAFTAVARAGDSAIAAFAGILFGPNVYYIESASLENNNGVSWFLLLGMLSDAYQRAPRGLFLWGTIESPPRPILVSNSAVPNAVQLLIQQARSCLPTLASTEMLPCIACYTIPLSEKPKAPGPVAG
jgi:hypothetical protein